uniref:Transmembrane protein n=1 Tax=Panagrolaimus davidi TaxID=227884 RepID=A0A914P9J2_9BILA
MELFVACIALIFFFKSHIHQLKPLPEIEEEIKPRSWFAWILIILTFFVIFIGPLYIIVAAPIINVTPKCTWLRDSRNIIRFITHLANVMLLLYMKYLFKIPFKFKWASEADIIIMWVAGIINAFKAISKFIINCAFLCVKMSESDGILFGIAQAGNTLESFSFYLLILVVERLLFIVEQPDNENTRRHLSKFTLTFIPLYFCASLIGFAAYYNLNSLRFFPDGVNSVVGINLIVFIQATYPTSMLFTMTVCLCMASIMEMLYQKNYYRLMNNVAISESS